MLFLSKLMGLVQSGAKHLSKAATAARFDKAISAAVLAPANLVEGATNIIESQVAQKGGRGA